jgi:hypothetical protein
VGQKHKSAEGYVFRKGKANEERKLHRNCNDIQAKNKRTEKNGSTRAVRLETDYEIRKQMEGLKLPGNSEITEAKNMDSNSVLAMDVNNRKLICNPL